MPLSEEEETPAESSSLLQEAEAEGPLSPPPTPAPPPVGDWAERVPRSRLHPRRYLQQLVASPSLRLWHKELLDITSMPDFETRYDADTRADLAEKLHRARVALDEKEDKMSNLLVTLGAVHGVYVGVVSSLLSLFTPQNCPPTAAIPNAHSCSLAENTRDLSVFNAGVLALNCFTLFTIALTESLIYRRENFLNKSLTVDDSFPPNNLSRPSIPLPGGRFASLLDVHSHIAAALRLTNRAVAASAKLCSFTIAANVTLSAAFILSHHSDGFRSVLSLISATMLIGTRFLTASFVCSAGLDDRGHASVSLYTMLHAVFNRLDEAYDVEELLCSGRIKGFGLEGMVAEEGEALLQLKELPKTKAVVAGVQEKVNSLLSVCTGSNVVRESSLSAGGGGARPPPPPPDDVERGKEEEQQPRRCLPCGSAKKTVVVAGAEEGEQEAPAEASE